jgi:uncharacterized protein (DUF58 family)
VLDYLPFLFFLLIIAAITREESVFTLFYLLAGAYLAGLWWSQRALKGLSFKRVFSRRAFLNETVPVRLEIVSASRLPIVWLRVQDNLPIELAGPELFRHAISLGSLGRRRFDYQLRAEKRGYYQIGPLQLRSGDLLGLTSDRRAWQGSADHLIVYPRIVPLSRLPLPSHSPLGTLRHTQPIFEDPSRVLSKRSYLVGDSLRRIDWKASAAIGQLQVKQFEPSIALEAAIFLNLNLDEYEFHTRLEAVELAIVVAASVANWIVGQRQAIGLITNGRDPFHLDDRLRVLPPRTGRGHLMSLLDLLARIQAGEASPIVPLIHQQSVQLAWGTTLIIITGQLDEPLIETLFRARRAGLNAITLLIGRRASATELEQRARHFGFAVVHLRTERDLDQWRQ